MRKEASPSELSSDAELLEKSQHGDRSAFSALVDRHQAAVFRFVRSLCRDAGAAEDALQETFISAWRNAAQFRGEGSVRGWLFSIARNSVRTEQRRATARRTEPETALEELGRAAGWGADPSDLMSSLERTDGLRQAFSLVSEDDREVLLLHDALGLSGEETANALGLGLAAMKSRLHRARLHVAAALRKGESYGA